jgi:hypothetical protein
MILKIKERVKQGPGSGAAGAGGLVPAIPAVAGRGFPLHERGQEFPLFDAHKPLVEFGMFLKILRCFLRFVMILGIVEHSRAHADLPFLAHEDIVVDAAFAAGPEGLILRELGIGDGLVAQFGIDLHDGQTRREAENFRFGIRLAAELEDLFFDLFGEAALSKARRYDQPGISHVLPVTPGLDIAEASPYIVIGEGDDRLALAHFLLNVIRASFSDAGPPGFRGGLHFVADDTGEILVGGISYQYLELLFHCLSDLVVCASER